MKTNKRLLLLLGLGAVLVHANCLSSNNNNGGWEGFKKKAEALKNVRPMAFRRVLMGQFPDLKSPKLESSLQLKVRWLEKKFLLTTGFELLKSRMTDLFTKILPSVKSQRRARAKINKEIKEVKEDLDTIKVNMNAETIEKNKPVWKQLKAYGVAVLEDLKTLKKKI